MTESIKVVKIVICQEIGCDTKPYARGYCKNHYQDKIRYGELEKTRGKKAACIFPHCNLPVESRNRCHIHYNQWSRA